MPANLSRHHQQPSASCQFRRPRRPFQTTPTTARLTDARQSTRLAQYESAHFPALSTAHASQPQSPSLAAISKLPVQAPLGAQPETTTTARLTDARQSTRLAQYTATHFKAQSTAHASQPHLLSPAAISKLPPWAPSQPPSKRQHTTDPFAFRGSLPRLRGGRQRPSHPADPSVLLYCQLLQ